MVQEKEVELKFLEHSLQQQENARRTFFRDLKIAAILLLAFQFAIFFRFIDLNEQKLRLDAQTAQLLNDQGDFSEVQAQLTSLKSTLQSGGRRLAKHLQEAPSSLRQQLIALGEFIRPSRSPNVPPMIQAGITQQQEIQQEQVPSPFFVEGLSETEINILRTANSEEKAFNNLVVRIVDKKLVPYLYAELNTRKRQLLEKPFAEKKGQLLTVLQDRRNTLEQYGQSTSEIEKKVNQVQARLRTLQFIPPSSKLWWRTFEGKQTVLRVDLNNTESVVTQLGRELQKPERDLASLGVQVTALIQEGEAKKKELDSQIEKLKSNHSEVQSLLENYAKPLSLVALEPEDTVVYYPIVLWIAFAYFLWRYILLHQRARSLVKAYRGAGVSGETLRAYFRGFPGITQVPRPEKALRSYPVARGLVAILCVVPGVLAAVSIHRILISPSLEGSSPLFLYLLVGGLFIISYVVLFLRVLRPTED